MLCGGGSSAAEPMQPDNSRCHHYSDSVSFLFPFAGCSLPVLAFSWAGVFDWLVSFVCALWLLAGASGFTSRLMTAAEPENTVFRLLHCMHAILSNQLAAGDGTCRRANLDPRRRKDLAREFVMHRSEEAQFLFSSAHSRVAKPAAFRGVGQAAHGRPSDHGRHCGDRSSNVLDRDVRSSRLSLQGDLKSLEHTTIAVVRLSLKRYNTGSVGPRIRSTRRGAFKANGLCWR